LDAIYPTVPSNPLSFDKPAEIKIAVNKILAIIPRG